MPFGRARVHPCGRDRRSRGRDAVFVERPVDPTRCAPSLAGSDVGLGARHPQQTLVELSTRSWLAHLGQPATQLQLTHITVHVDDGCTVPGTVTRSRPRTQVMSRTHLHRRREYMFPAPSQLHRAASSTRTALSRRGSSTPCHYPVALLTSCWHSGSKGSKGTVLVLVFGTRCRLSCRR